MGWSNPRTFAGGPIRYYCFFLLSQANAPQYYLLDPASTLRDALAGKIIVEHPTFLILLPGQLSGYTLVTRDSEDAPAATTAGGGTVVGGTAAGAAGSSQQAGPANTHAGINGIGVSGAACFNSMPTAMQKSPPAIVPHGAHAPGSKQPVGGLRRPQAPMPHQRGPPRPSAGPAQRPRPNNALPPQQAQQARQITPHGAAPAAVTPAPPSAALVGAPRPPPPAWPGARPPPPPGVRLPAPPPALGARPPSFGPPHGPPPPGPRPPAQQLQPGAPPYMHWAAQQPQMQPVQVVMMMPGPGGYAPYGAMMPPGQFVPPGIPPGMQYIAGAVPPGMYPQQMNPPQRPYGR